MARNAVDITASPDDVFDVLDDGWCYDRWVVGTANIRSVDVSWPTVGSAFHHQVLSRFGLVSLRDRTIVRERDRPHRLVLETRLRPAGDNRVELTVAPTVHGCHVVLDERPVSWNLRPVAPLLDPLLHVRNGEALRRLRGLVEQRAGADAGTGGRS